MNFFFKCGWFLVIIAFLPSVFFFFYIVFEMALVEFSFDFSLKKIALGV